MPLRKGKKGEVTFVFESAPAKTVYVAGDFNDWDPKANKMVKTKDGSFRTKLSLAPGQHQYKFIADGTWVTDDQADKVVSNEFGTVNSVVEIG
ncbi:MAG: hypothetical protein A2Y07_00830 [Planctomycetes bacterium GWF2_50_10]|nr:MAG: hypothetical protein A2Y07_00830 [Planctomycetes bacterium GWF2_50_10]